MNKKRTIMLGIFIVATLGVVLSRFYLNVQNEHWDEKRVAVEKAYAQSMLTKASNVDFFYGDEAIQIVYGENKLGQNMIAWVTDADVHTEMTDEAFTEAQVKEAVLKRTPGSEIERVMPGKLGNTYVWEAFYKTKDDRGTRYFYDYYAFQDGTYIDTFRLSLQ